MSPLLEANAIVGPDLKLCRGTQSVKYQLSFQIIGTVGLALTLFRRHPMDGTGKTNSFVAQADGTAKVSMTLPDFPTHANAVLLIYDSEGQTHGLERGRIGVDAHHQLIARPE